MNTASPALRSCHPLRYLSEQDAVIASKTLGVPPEMATTADPSEPTDMLISGETRSSRWFVSGGWAVVLGVAVVMGEGSADGWVGLDFVRLECRMQRVGGGRGVGAGHSWHPYRSTAAASSWPTLSAPTGPTDRVPERSRQPTHRRRCRRRSQTRRVGCIFNYARPHAALDCRTPNERLVAIEHAAWSDRPKSRKVLNLHKVLTSRTGVASIAWCCRGENP